MIKKILCYGDSNTWGCSPFDGTRFDATVRWPMVMGSILGDDYIVIEDGLNGRTVLNLSPVNPLSNGIEGMEIVISNYTPFDIAIISLGLNDVFIGGEVTLTEISSGIEIIIDIIRTSHIKAGYKTPDIIIMAPPEFNKGIDGAQFFELQINKLKALPGYYKKIASQKDCLFFDAAGFVTGSIIDGSHLEAESQILLGKKTAEFILDRIK